MDFGDILNKWEKGQSATTNSGEMESWLRGNKVFDKDAEDSYKTQSAGEHRRRLRQGKPDDILDIHGLSGDKALVSLDLFFTRARDCGYEKLRIIHGKGNHSQGDAILSRTVRDFIEQCPYAGESGFEKSAAGGSGATWVLLKKPET